MVLESMRTQLQQSSQPLDSFQKLVNTMTRHNSYGKSNKGSRKRNVLKRFERIDVLRKMGKWVDGANKQVTALPKTPSA